MVECPDISAIIDPMRRNGMAVTMAGDENNLLPAQLTECQGAGSLPKRGTDDPAVVNLQILETG
jgi:hypothetical protein